MYEGSNKQRMREEKFMTVLFMRWIVSIFVWWDVAILLAVFGRRYIYFIKIFNLFKVEGTITGTDSCQIRGETYNISIIDYQIYDMKYKTYISKSRGDKIGDKVLIATNGDISVRYQIAWRDIVEGIVSIVILSAIFGWIIYKWGSWIDNITIYTALGISTVYFLLWPFIYSYSYKDLKNEFGYLYRY